MSSKQSINVKGAMDFEGVISFLSDFLVSFKERKVCVQRGEEFVTLKPGDQVEMEIEAQEKKGKQKVSLELSWKTDLPLEGDKSFKVSSMEPEVKAPEPAPAETATAQVEAAAGESVDTFTGEGFGEDKAHKGKGRK